jgi:hypothetical protein
MFLGEVQRFGDYGREWKIYLGMTPSSQFTRGS